METEKSMWRVVEAIWTFIMEETRIFQVALYLLLYSRGKVLIKQTNGKALIFKAFADFLNRNFLN